MTPHAARPQTLPTTAFLGAGSMGSAILEGLAASEVAVNGGIRVTNRQPSDRERPENVTAYSTELNPEANRTAVSGAGIVLLGVKPAMIPALLDDIAPALEPGTVVISLAVGVTIESMEQRVPESIAVVRSMPNTPTAVRRGVTALARGTNVSDEQLALAEALFAAVGDAIIVPESKMDAVAAISGSGPAYVYLLVEEVTKAAVGLGFSHEDAARLVAGTFTGAVELLRQSGRDPGQLRREVTSPGGTTEQAIGVLQEGGLEALFAEAMAAAIARAEEIEVGS